MSFHIDFLALSANAAKEKIAREHAPDCVKVFLLSAVDGARKASSFENPVYHVKAIGHLCDDGMSHAVSTADLSVIARQLV